MTYNMFYTLSTILFSTFLIIILYLKWSFNYWKRNGLESLDPTIPWGNCKNMIMKKSNFGEQIQQIYNKFKYDKHLRHGGMYLLIRPVYVPIDPTIIKNILQKDFQYFINHGSYYNEKIDPLSAHLFNLNDSKWKQLRAKLNPAFTSGKMKMLFDTVKVCADNLSEIINVNIVNNNSKTTIEINGILERFTCDVIGSCAFGLDCNCLNDPESLFYKYGKRFFENDAHEALTGLMAFSLPHNWLRFFQMKITKTDVEQFFMNVVRKTVNYRETNNIDRKDLLQLLLELKHTGEIRNETNNHDEFEKLQTQNEFKISVEQIAAQVYVFYVAGFETTSATITFALYELALNLTIQEKLRKEIISVLSKHNNEITYDAIMEMTFMDQIINETLRKYPPFPVLFRLCGADYPVPNTSVTIKKNTLALISVLGIHHDPEYYPEPDKFDPDRFSEEQKSRRSLFTPFGEGPRICIGLRFGLMQSKIAIATILRNYKVTLNEKTSVPLEMEKLGIVTKAQGGIWLDITNINLNK